MEVDEKEKKEETTKSLGYRMGEWLGVALIFSAIVIITAVTAKIVLWMF